MNDATAWVTDLSLEEGGPQTSPLPGRGGSPDHTSPWKRGVPRPDLSLVEGVIRPVLSLEEGGPQTRPPLEEGVPRPLGPSDLSLVEGVFRGSMGVWKPQPSGPKVNEGCLSLTPGRGPGVCSVKPFIKSTHIVRLMRIQMPSRRTN